MYLLLMLATVAGPAFGQILPFKTYSAKDGLLSNDIECISQDSRGYMWFGTTDGISVFDGTSFTNYTIHEGLPGNVVTQILADRKNPETMWILAGGNLCKHADGRFTVYKMDANVIYIIYQDIHDVVWCGTDRGAFIISGSVVTPFHPLDLNKDVSGIAEIGDSVMWFARNISLTHYSRTTNEFREITIRHAGTGDYRSMSADNQGNLWVTKGGGALLQIQGTGIINQRSDAFGSNIYDVKGENVWAIGYDGVSSISKSRFATAPIIRYTKENGLPENTLRSAFLDKEANLWLGGRDQGVAKLSNWNISRFPLGSVWYVHHHEFAAADTNNHLWVIAKERLTEFWKDHYGGWHRFAHTIARADSLVFQDVDVSRIFSSLFYDAKGRLWISSLKCPGPIECYEIIPDSSSGGDRHSTLRLINTVWVGREFGAKQMGIFCFIVDGNEDLWVSIANEGIAHYSLLRNGDLVRAYDEPNEVNYIRMLYEDHSGNIWAGSFNSGLFKLQADEISTGKFHRYTTSDGLPDDAIWDIRKDRLGRVLVATSNGGLAVWGRDSIRTLSYRDGLPSNKIFSITEDSLGRLWLGTSVGMVHEDHPGSGSFLKRQPFVGSSALCSGATRNGLIWFITSTDLFVYDYLHDTKDTIPPPAYLNQIKVNGDQRMMQSDIQLPHGENNLEISFIGLSFKDEGEIRYLYRLVGTGTEWQGPTHNSSITYGHLDPGSYRFEVKAVNIDGTESALPASLSFMILPPFWQAWWFLSSVTLVLLFVGPVIYYRRVSTLKRGQLADQEFSRQLIESQEAERKRVAGELHDGLGQELMVIINQAQMALRSAAADSTREQIQEIAGTASRAINNVREIAFDLSPYHLEQIGLVESMKSKVDKVASLSSIKFTVECDPVDRLMTKDLELNVYRIVQECVNNIVKHSQASQGRIGLKAIDHRIEIIISDDGIGFDASAPVRGSQMQNGFGLRGLAERVKLIKGSLEINSSPGSGTRISIRIPLTNH